MRNYRKSNNSPYFAANEPIVFLPDNEFGLFLAENPNLRAEGEKYDWNINHRYDELQPVTKEAIEGLFASSVEYVMRSAQPRIWKYGLARELILNYVLPEDMSHVLDFGCGAGNDGMFYANLGLKTTFADVDGIQLQYVRWRLARRAINFCSVIPSKELQDKNKFDLALLVDVLEHIVDAHESFERVVASLKTNGLLYLSFNSEGHGLDCYSIENFESNIKPILNSKFKQECPELYRKISD